MAKKSLKRRNIKRIKISNMDKKRRDELKKECKNQNLSFKERLDTFFKLSGMRRDGSKVRIRSRCNLTGRPRGNLRNFGVSRIAFRELALSGLIPGVIKSS